MATMTTPVTDTKRIPGGSFLISDPTPSDCFFPEDFTDEHKQIAETTANFAINEIMPVSDQIEAKDFTVTRRLLKEAADLGLTSVDIPEEYGGLEMDKVSSAIVAENIAKQASFSVAFSAHVGIGTLPLVWYGTPEQKKKYLPKIASGKIDLRLRALGIHKRLAMPSTPALAPCSPRTARPTRSTARRCGSPMPVSQTSSPSSRSARPRRP